MERADGHRQPHGLRPQASIRSAAASRSRTSTRRRRSTWCPTSSSRRPASTGCSWPFSSRRTGRRRSEGRSASVLRFHPELAPVSVAVLPLLKKREEIVRTAQALRDDLARHWTAHYDDTAAIGRLYRRQDEVGTRLLRHGGRADRRRRGEGGGRRRQGDHPRSRLDGAGSRADTRARSRVEGSARRRRLDGRRWSIWRRADPSGLVACAARRAATCSGRHGLCACGRAGERARRRGDTGRRQGRDGRTRRGGRWNRRRG